MPELNDAMISNHSFWQYKYGDYSANTALPHGSYETDVLVIGAGYTGLTCAREIRKDDKTKRVMVLDANEIGFGASGRNGGFNMTLFGVEPEVTQLRWRKEKPAKPRPICKRLIADLVLGKDTSLTKFWVVNRKAIPMPPGNILRFAGVKLIEGILTAVDRYEESGSRTIKPRK
ncbi:FAD-dependent oxidoreductase [Marinobacter panjinensis]|uniref:FAD-dependent oxidoreductase n=1 Tax=Marinobacter panjinensis TaxID=2576384 RepID=A0A4U6R3F7_9GAMM|nr:FAD-dependent oxidoreductase [Marinobacter panjinensis]